MTNDAFWSSDVRVSMPEPLTHKRRVPMFGFVFTDKGLFHDLSAADHATIGTPTFAPQTGLGEVTWGDDEVDESSIEILDYF